MQDSRRLSLERDVLKGQQACECLKFFPEFEKEQARQLWDAVAKGNKIAIERLSGMAVISRAFSDYLKEKENAGLVASAELDNLE